ncbi:hypothetical protein K501DRAFT_242518 [Backusella circina FSU 941]|nr:hypothetical protein K501DRAFT_242518 [Backusella circina FSU 941]
MQRFLSKNQGGEKNEWHDRLVGKVILTDDEETTLAADKYIRKKDLPTPHRVLPPGAIMTMDYRPERLNINVDDTKRVTGCNFG